MLELVWVQVTARIEMFSDNLNDLNYVNCLAADKAGEPKSWRAEERLRNARETQAVAHCQMHREESWRREQPALDSLTNLIKFN